MAIRTVMFVAASLASLTATSAFAQATVAGHPRVNEVNQRLENQETRTDAGVNSGTITAKQEERDQARDAKVSQEESADEAKHNGHLTKKEQRHMNRQLNRNSEHIKDQKAEPGASTAR